MIAECQGLHIEIEGAVQGVGFRPFVYRLAQELGLAGIVHNTAQGVFIEIEGTAAHLELFLERLEREKPPLAIIHRINAHGVLPVGHKTFEIHHSKAAGQKTALLLPDIAICPDCLHEIFDPANRRYRYPFTNCTHCGPRYSIIEALPYDRANTSMRLFEMCDSCRAEYEDPANRRFHAQPNACPDCGPQLALWDRRGHVLANRHEALLLAAEAIRQGQVVALKGLGGFQLLVNARDESAVSLLRERKQRPDKPFALTYPSLDMIRAHCEVSALEAELLQSSAAPITLLKSKDAPLACNVAPHNPYLGIMLPYTPLHHLLMADLGFPVVATSGNLSDEPICIDEQEALQKLGEIADLFLVHNRPIVRPVDDSVIQVTAGRMQVLRRARGYAPLPVIVNEAMPPVLGLGADLKNTVAVSGGNRIFVSQHVGDLEGLSAMRSFERTIGDFERLYEWSPTLVAHDLHPDYFSSRYANSLNYPRIAVQHHYAHVLSCMAENGIDAPVLGICWDGTGYGLDGTIWGGEFLRIDETSFTRAAHLRTFRLPGADRAVREPRRAALGLLYEVFGDALFERSDLAPLDSLSLPERRVIQTMLKNGLNSPLTSSAGRLFDAVASLLHLCHQSSYEGQAAMQLEWAAQDSPDRYTYDWDERAAVLDWEPLIRGILDDLALGLNAGEIAAKFHNTLLEMMVDVAHFVGLSRVALTGGCFQNKLLSEGAITRLRQEGFDVYWHSQLPPNDGGISIGQVVAAVREGKRPCV